MEQRKFKRVAFGARVGILADGNYNFGQASKLGEGGMLVRMENPKPVGSEIELHFNLTQDKLIIVKGTIRYVLANNAMGVEFKDLVPRLRTAIQSYITVHGS